MKKLTIIVRTCGDRLSMLAETLRAIAALEGVARDELEVLVVYDHGDMNPPRAAKRYQDLRELVAPLGGRVLVSPLAGRSHAASTGLRSFKGELVGFCDDDDVLLPRWLVTLERALERDPVAGAAHGDVQVVHCDAENRPLRPGRLYEGPFTPAQLLAANRKPNNAFLFRREAVLGERFLADEPLCEDWGFLLRLLKKGVRFTHAPEVVAEYRIRGEGHSNTDPEAMLRATEQLRRRYAGVLA